MRNDDRSVAPVLAVVLLVATTVLIGVSVTTFVLYISESLSDPAPTATFETETTEDGTVELRHTAGKTLAAENLEIKGGVVRGEMPESVEAGTTIEIAPSDETTSLVWESNRNDDAAVLKNVERSPHPLTATGVSELWRHSERDYPELAVTDEHLYGISSISIYRINPNTGNQEPRWFGKTVGGTDSFNDITKSPEAVYAGSQYLGAGEYDEGGVLVAVDTASGEKTWDHTEHGDDQETIEAVKEHNGVVYSLGMNSRFFGNASIIATDASSGTVLWEKSLPADRDSLDLDITQGVVSTGYAAFDASDGSKVWEIGSRYDIIRDIDGKNGVLYIATTDTGTVAALDVDDGSTIWEEQINTESSSENAITIHESQGVLYTAGNNDRVIALDSADGSILWSHDLHNETIYTVTEQNGVVYSSDEGSNIIAAELEYGD